MEVCLEGVILALQEGSSLPKHLSIVKVYRLSLAPPQDLTGHFDEATEPVFASQSQVNVPSINTEHYDRFNKTSIKESHHLSGDVKQEEEALLDLFH